jgi:Concanavalin A-like lectin/glucanases superfamily
MKLKQYIWAAALLVVGASCQKMERPKLEDYPRDANAPGGPLKFYVAFDGSSPDPLRNAVDSIRANFASENPFTSITGISGKAAQGVSQKAIKYASANDFAGASSFTISFWEKNNVPTGGNAQFVFSVPSTDYWHGSGIFLLIDHDGAGSTSSQAVVKLAVQDHWFEFTGANRMPGNLLNNQWHHMAFVYNATTSKMAYYVDGQPVTGLPSNLVDWLDGGSPHGPVVLRNVSNFVLGGWNKHVGASGPTDSWIESWQGGLDQFRLYGKALTASEVLALFNSKL